ncbi:hypothetical protein LSM04_002589 [Trypanosoma melophagium]|uniref:uncharacterized protein n=1 Tax=Trypanosoma melophagium TaxID=715481 RepID=UPI00351A24C7|nr:hypothetical protein LSM04_002589 [Trypanosoma melophagium]
MDAVAAQEIDGTTVVWRKAALPLIAILLIVIDAPEKRDARRSCGIGILPLKGCVIGKEGSKINFDTDIIFHGKSVEKNFWIVYVACRKAWRRDKVKE